MKINFIWTLVILENEENKVDRESVEVYEEVGKESV